MTVQPGSVQAAITIPAGDKVRIVNATHDIAGNLPLSPSATPRILGAQRQVGIIDSIVGFFSGLFGKKVSCPSGTVNCGGGCIDTRSDWQNCGTCGMTCFDPAICCGGECVDVYLTQWGQAGWGDGQFNRPIGIAVNPLGYVYVIDENNNRVQKFGCL